jgi:hypothetical protein
MEKLRIRQAGVKMGAVLLGKRDFPDLQIGLHVAQCRRIVLAKGETVKPAIGVAALAEETRRLPEPRACRAQRRLIDAAWHLDGFPRASLGVNGVIFVTAYL